jgi:hypothetical protein
MPRSVMDKSSLVFCMRSFLVLLHGIWRIGRHGSGRLVVRTFFKWIVVLLAIIDIKEHRSNRAYSSLIFASFSSYIWLIVPIPISTSSIFTN